MYGNRLYGSYVVFQHQQQQTAKKSSQCGATLTAMSIFMQTPHLQQDDSELPLKELQISKC
jgi:hypothetical protein